MTTFVRTRVPGLAVVLLWLFVASASAQEFRGRINGVVTDDTGAVLPGVTVTATSPAMIQPQIQVTGADGSYRFFALNPGVYTLTFELAGFQTLQREGIRVVINQTLTVDQQMRVATLQETVTVTGESPVIDTSTTTVGTNFTKELLTEIPNARDIWAAMSQAPGLQMSGYDVGGSHTGTQTGYLTYGMNDQNQTKVEGIDTTESTNANAGYFDFGSFEEFQIGGAGNTAETYASGANLNITVKSGGDRFTGTWYSDWEGDATISNNVPEELQAAGGRTKDGYFTRDAIARGNPIDRQYDLNGSVGGTFQLPRSNQIIGFLNKREKLQALREFGPARPVSAAWYQSSRNYPMKIEWTSVVTSRMFLDVMAAQWYNFFPLRPTYEGELYPREQLVAGRLDTSTNQYFDGGAMDSYQDRKRFKPQFYAALSYFKEGRRGSHDLRTGFDWKRDRRKEGRDQPFNIFYRDLRGAPNELDLYNGPNEGITDVKYSAFYVNDIWKFSDRVTLTVGARVEHYSDGWPDQEFEPEGVAALAGWTDPRWTAFIAPRAVSATTVAKHTTFAPRMGFAYELPWDRRTVLKGYYGRFYFNSSDTLANLENPVGMAQLRFRFNDLNGNRVLDGPQELGALLQTLGGAGFVRIDRDIKRPYSDEISAHVERELVPGRSARGSWIYKNIRSEWDEIDRVREHAYAIPVTRIDPGPDEVTDTADDAPLSLLDRPAGMGSERVYTNPEVGYNSDFNTVELALNRRFAGRWMALTSFGYTWLDQFHSWTQATTSPLESAAMNKAWDWNPNLNPFGRETSTNVELQAHWPLRAAPGHRRQRILQGAERAQLGTEPCCVAAERRHDDRPLSRLRRGGRPRWTSSISAWTRASRCRASTER